MIKKIITALLIIAALWFFVDRTLNYGAVNARQTERERNYYYMNWMDRR